MQRARRTSSQIAAKRITSQVQQLQAREDSDPPSAPSSTRPKRLKANQPIASPDASHSTDDSNNSDSDAAVEPVSEADEPAPPAKRRKVTRAAKNGSSQLDRAIFGTVSSASASASVPACRPPQRHHSLSYHRPLLLNDRTTRENLLAWFDGVSTTRSMPWRKPWLDPASFAAGQDGTKAAPLRSALERRAYEVWISEIMLQQTRVAVVIGYWNAWMARWPTIHDLAAASPEDVLAAWRGLGYYSRATRIHEAAKMVVADAEMQGLLPEDVGTLQAKVPGVGRYTAGAISAIVFGHAAPMVDGNVLRVLSRQLGVYGNVKTSKRVLDALWTAADALVMAVAADGPNIQDESGSVAESASNRTLHASDIQPSDRPGRWGQALMELGSTICTPKPDCSVCPITSTCRAYAEGALLLSDAADSVDSYPLDIEDLCTLCEPFEEEGLQSRPIISTQDNVRKGRPRPSKQPTLSSFAFTSAKNAKGATPDKQTADLISDYARRYPTKIVKKAVREEEILVCAIRRSDGQFLIHRRPEKGLLAGLWEFPSHTLPASNDSTAKTRQLTVLSFASDLIGKRKGASRRQPVLTHVGEAGSVPWLFSHLKLTMHVHLFALDDEGRMDLPGRWATTEEVEAESMGTGMRKCWALVRESFP